MNVSVLGTETHDWLSLFSLRCQAFADQPAFRVLSFTGNSSVEKIICYDELYRNARAIAAQLSQNSVVGEPVVLVYPFGIDFIQALFGTLLAGAIPVPAKPPTANLNSFVDTLNRQLLITGARYVCSDQKFVGTYAAKFETVHWLDTTCIEHSVATQLPLIDVSPNDIALIQFTSGSTGQPRGIKISHANLIANCRSIVASGFYGTAKQHLSWMPHFHDMGLVGAIFGCIYGGVTSTLMSPSSFLRDPKRWLRAIDKYRISSSGSPNFGYALLNQLTIDSEADSLDLSSWKVAYCGAEQIQHTVLEEFSSKYAAFGFEASSVMPCYGMAEATLLVSSRKGLITAKPEQAPIRAENTFVLNSAAIVSVGSLTEDSELRIIDRDTGQTLSDGQVGEICFRSDSLMLGYVEDKPSLESPFDSNGFFHTGDLGFTYGHELYISGRMKEVIVIRGQNIFPQDIERIVEQFLGLTGQNCVAAFSLNSGDANESLGIVIGTRERTIESKADVCHRVREIVTDYSGILPHTVAMVPARQVSKTSSGKVQRGAIRNAWHQDELTLLAQVGSTDSAYIFDESIYPDFLNQIAKIDSRNTRYQFDLETDVEWERFEEPGRFFSDQYLQALGIDVEIFRQYPDALQFLEWSLALTRSVSFEDSEDAALQWARKVDADFAGSNSLALFDEEEIKHIQLFKRCTRHLKALNPSWVERTLTCHTLDKTFFKDLVDPTNYDSPRHHHYSIWLAILYFEDYTVWLYKALASEAETIQPSWLQAQFCHYKEESQHVITDFAYVSAIDASEAEKLTWSERVFRTLFDAIKRERTAVIALVEDRYPELRGKIGNQQPDLNKMLSHRAFAKTRASAPFLGNYFGTPASQPRTYKAHQTCADVLETLQSIFATTTGKPELLPFDRSFGSLGLDSVGHVRLAVEIEQELDATIEWDQLYEHGTFRSLTQLICHQLNITFVASAFEEQTAGDATSSETQAAQNYSVVNESAKTKPLFWLNGPDFVALFERNLPQQKIVYLHHQGTDGKRATHFSVNAMADYYAQMIISEFGGEECYLGGFSIGATLAYEVAIRLENAGCNILGLLMLSPTSPETENNFGPYTKSKHIMRQFADDFRKSLQLSAVHTIQAIKETYHKVLINRYFAESKKMPPNLHWTYLKPIYIRASLEYAPEKPYFGKTMIIYERNNPQVLQWQPFLKGDLSIIDPIDCDHMNFIEKIYASQWLKEVRSLLSYGDSK